jgi:hypothetical protein
MLRRSSFHFPPNLKFFETVGDLRQLLLNLK